jgi:hypothetical protein
MLKEKSKTLESSFVFSAIAMLSFSPVPPSSARAAVQRAEVADTASRTASNTLMTGRFPLIT